MLLRFLHISKWKLHNETADVYLSVRIKSCQGSLFKDHGNSLALDASFALPHLVASLDISHASTCAQVALSFEIQRSSRSILLSLQSFVKYDSVYKYPITSHPMEISHCNLASNWCVKKSRQRCMLKSRFLIH